MNKLKEIRKSKKITQKEMAKYLGYRSTSSYHYIEAGKTKLTLEKAKKLCEILNLSIEDMLSYIQETCNKKEVS